MRFLNKRPTKEGRLKGTQKRNRVFEERKLRSDGGCVMFGFGKTEKTVWLLRFLGVVLFLFLLC